MSEPLPSRVIIMERVTLQGKNKLPGSMISGEPVFSARSGADYSAATVPTD